ncbi:hypothetical protein ACP275_08G122300 [Erythranthe tilingii]
MNYQPHHSGHISGQVPNQAGTILPGLPQQNGTLAPSHMQNPSIDRGVANTDSEYGKARSYMQEKIWNYFMQRRQQSQEMTNRTMVDLVRRFDEALYKSATTTEEYLNLATLERRLLHLMKRSRMINNHNQQFSHANSSSSSIGTMIPTPGLQQTGNPSLAGAQSMDNNFSNTIASSTAKSGNVLPARNVYSGNVHGGSFSSSDGALASVYQQPSSSFPVNSGGDNMVTSMGVQRITSQMIPTPGFNSSNNHDVHSNANNKSFVDVELSNNAGAFPAVESSIVSQPMQQKQRVGGQNSRIMHNTGGGIRSTLQQKSNGLSNGPINGGLARTGNNMSIMNASGTTEGYFSGTVYGNSTRPLHQHFDQHQRPVMQGGEYGGAVADVSGSGNLYVTPSSVGSTMNNQSLNAVAMRSMPKTNTHLISNQANVHPTQQIQQHVQHQVQQRQQAQNQVSLKNDTFGQSQVSGVKSGHGGVHHNEGLHSQVSDTFQFSNMQSQFQQNSMEDLSQATQLLPSGPRDVSSSLIQTSDQMQQLLHPQQFVANTQSEFGNLGGGNQTDTELHSNPQGVSHSRLLHDHTLQNEFHHRLTGQDVAQLNNLSSEESMIGQPHAPRSAELPNTSNGVCRSNNLDRERQFRNQLRWLLFLYHARRCGAPKGQCQDPNCVKAQSLMKHIKLGCGVRECSYPRCSDTRKLMKHNRDCRDVSCPVCVPFKGYVKRAQSEASAVFDTSSGLPSSVNGSCKTHEIAEITGRSTPKTSTTIAETSEDLHPSIKRMKIEQGSQSVVSGSEASVPLASAVNESPLKDAQHSDQHLDSHIPMKYETTKVKMEALGNVGQLTSRIIEMKKDNFEGACSDPTPSNNSAGFGMQEVIKSEREMKQPKMENQPLPSENTSKSGKPNIKGVSMTELFTPEQVRQHITGLRQWVGQSKAKAEKNQAMERSMSENSCQLCAVEKLAFEPPPTYCTPCGARIKRNALYYTIGAGETRHYFCIPCYNEARGDTIVVDGTTIAKARMEKKKNDEETEEWWVQCDKCEAWQHQICALFNGRRNDGGQAEYTCPNCYVEEVESGERMPLPQSAVLGAKDLPRTILSDHIEQRLFAKLKQERQDRARFQGKGYDEVPGAEALVVRVVSSVDKKLDVKPRFLEIFQEENYPIEYAYKSKVVLLFQKIEGVEVCLFGMYVQEFGSECQQPNHRRVYLSYLDSVKYFRPEVRTVTGEALRTFVYHEILIGYLEYCKKRGFTSCYIWACPPLKGEDYILYCHPEIQKTPKSDKLREWYLAMLRKAAKENIVVDLTNLYDHFFISNGECKAKVTAARLPYFDGDYWPGAAEDMIHQLQQEEDGRKQQKKGPMKKTITKRALKASGQTDLSGNVSKDLLLMHKLGETISPMKEDFIMVHLQPACTHCCILMVSGNRWVCRQCKNFQLCGKCYDAERRLEDRERHPINQKDKHALYPVEITCVPDGTKDKDEILESEFFDTRQAFLSLCQGNHYQYDTLRRAKHSSMMVLYHLHNPTAPAFVTTCNVCHLDIETGQGWRCETCPDYDVCNGCYQKDGGIGHPHKLTNHPSNDRDAQNKEARQLRVTQLRKMLDLLVHASQCRSSLCQYPNCRKVKGLFRHGMLCKVRASGGCHLCKKMWYLLQLHARACKDPNCNVPRCRDLKEHLRRLQQQSDSRRRAAVMEMMRQRAAEVAGSS